MVAVAEVEEFFGKSIAKEALIEIEDDFLYVPKNSGQGIHALQGMLSNSVLHENSTRNIPTDLNLALRAVEISPSRMGDLFPGEDLADNLNRTDEMSQRADEHSGDHADAHYRPIPFLDQGMLSFYMHAHDREQGMSGFPMSELIQKDELVPVPETPLLH